MKKIGVIEGFFGPQWPLEDRKSYAAFLAQYGGGFYIYAPKQDPLLRKTWRNDWSVSYLTFLNSLSDLFHKEGVEFGVGFSPFGLDLGSNDKEILTEKIKQLNSLKVNILGLFFDDMPVNDKLAENQIDALKLLKSQFNGKIIFCPSYYSDDSILDKVFGQRPLNYLEDIASGIPLDVSIAWTGPKVISPELTDDHLLEKTALLKRKPFVWENLYANDGPKNCKFLKLKPFSGRSKGSILNAEAFGFNLMNQAQLSKILFLSSKYVLEGESNVDMAFHNAIKKLCSHDFAEFLSKNSSKFLNQGLDQIGEDEKNKLILELTKFPDLAALEIVKWLKGEYVVGPDCLTD